MLKSHPSVCLSVRHADKSAHINTLPASLHKPIILLLQVCHCNLIQYQIAFCSGLKTKKWRKLEQDSMGRATDLHSGGRGSNPASEQIFFSLKSIFLRSYTFLKFKFSIDNTVTWHYKHASKWDLSEN